jgi:hypothetical protein
VELEVQMLLQKQFNFNEYLRVNYARCVCFFVLCALSISLVSCVTTQTKPYETHEKTIEMDGYTVDRPPGNNWKAIITTKDNKVEFSRKTPGNESDALSNQTIMINENGVTEKSMWKLSKLLIAKEYFRYEQSGLDRGALLRQIEIDESFNESNLKTINVNNKELYNSNTKYKSLKNDYTAIMIIEQSMYLYFPPGYKEDDKFIIFLVSESYPPEMNKSADRSIVFPVIKSLQIDLEKLNE